MSEFDSPKRPKRFDKATLYTIDDNYISSLKKLDYKVQNNYKGQRLYFKTDIEISDGIYQYVPLSSAKESQKSINNKSVFKLYGDKEKEDFLGVIHINNMIPAPDFFVKEWSPQNKDLDERYMILVIKQAKYIKSHMNEINSSCLLLRNSKIGNIDPVYFKENRNEIMLYKKITTDVHKLEDFSKKTTAEYQLSKKEFELE